MGSQMEPLDLTLSDLQRSKSKSLGFQSLISHKRAELALMFIYFIYQYIYPGWAGYKNCILPQRPAMLLLTINRKPYMASRMTSSLLTLSDLERSKSKSLGF